MSRWLEIAGVDLDDSILQHHSNDEEDHEAIEAELASGAVPKAR